MELDHKKAEINMIFARQSTFPSYPLQEKFE